MGKLDGIGGVKAPGGFRDGKRKRPFAASRNISFQAGISSSRDCCLGDKEHERTPRTGGGVQGESSLEASGYEPQAALDTGQKVRDLLGWPWVPKRAGEVCARGKTEGGEEGAEAAGVGVGQTRTTGRAEWGRHSGLGKAAPVNSPQFSTTPCCQPPAFGIQLLAAATNSKRAVTL